MGVDLFEAFGAGAVGTVAVFAAAVVVIFVGVGGFVWIGFVKSALFAFLAQPVDKVFLRFAYTVDARAEVDGWVEDFGYFGDRGDG